MTVTLLCLQHAAGCLQASQGMHLRKHVHLIAVLFTAGQLRVLPHAAEVLNKGSRITACSLHRDTGSFFAPPEPGARNAAPVLCLVCKSNKLDILQLPTMATLLTFCNVSEGPRLLSNAPGKHNLGS